MRLRTDDRKRKEFLRRYRLAIEHAGLSQTELGRRTGQSSQAVSDQLSKENLPIGEIMLMLPDALGVSGHWLLTGRGSMIPTEDASMERVFGSGARSTIAEMRAALEVIEARWTRGKGTESGALDRVEETDPAAESGRRRPRA